MRGFAGFIALIVTGWVAVTTPALCTDIRQTVSLDAGWRFQRADVSDGGSVTLDDHGWQAVNLPHTYNADDGFDAKTYRGPAWYRRTLILPAPAADRRVFMEFDGAALAADVWLNGVKLGHHDGGFARFRFDVTSMVKTGGNLLAVRVDNNKMPGVAPLGGDYTVFGGLYRDVRLVTTRDVHFDMQDFGGSGVYFKSGDVSGEKAHLSWTARVTNERASPVNAKVMLRLYDAQHEVVITQSKTAFLPPNAVTVVAFDAVLTQPHLWQGVRDPYLYSSEVEVAAGAPLDRITIPIGIRDIRLDADRGLLLNGQPYGVHGVDIHQTMRPGKGPAVGDAEMDADFDMLQDMGVTGLRFAHYQHAQHEYDLADRRGILVWTELPMSSAVDPSDAFSANIAQQLRELIRQNYNHPSVFVWGLGNEIYKVDDVSARSLEAMQTLAHTEDPTRPTTYANCCSEIDGPQASHTDVIGSNVYFGWYSGNFADLGPWLDKNHTRRPATPEAISEYGAGASVFHQEDPPLRPKTSGHWHPEQYQALYHEAAWQQMSARPYLWATFVWAGFDFPSAGRSEGDHAGINDKGLITFDRRIKKDAYFWYQANWTDKAMVYITSRRDIVRHTPEVDVKLYSNQPDADLRLNGVDLGSRPVTGHIVLWHVTLAPGRNHLEAAAGEGRDTVDWVYQPIDAKP